MSTGHPTDIASGAGDAGFALALVEEAAKRAGVAWVTPDAHPTRPAWFVWRDRAALLVTGPGEQVLPGLTQAAGATVVFRAKDTGGLLVGWRATVTVLAPRSAEWETAVPVLVGERLNL